MRVPAAVVALPVFAGAAAGVILCEALPDRLILAAAFAAVLCTMAGAYVCTDDGPEAVLICVAVGALCGGYAIGGAVTRDLLAPPLLQWFETQGEDEDGPVLVQGTLREDAAVVPYGVVLTVDVETVSTWSGSNAAPGGARKGAR